MATSDDLPLLVSVPALARKLRRARRTLSRQLLRLHTIDREEGRPEWLFVVPGDGGRRRHVRVNEGALYAAHPELHRARTEKPVDAESLLARVGSVEKSTRDHRKFVKQQFAKIFSRIASLETAKS